ncbi:filamin-A-like [Antedon mediterranea]|uniref:filamin-A-like n=1 Tax=Antedon mediterranea TaxID=105859 RepID=UPI003AF52448
MATMTARYVSSLRSPLRRPNPVESALLNLSMLKRDSIGYFADLGEKVTFQIRLTDPSLSVNDLAVEVENLGEPAEVHVYAFDHQEVEVSFIPRERVQHKVNVRYHGQTIDGCPFNVMISPEIVPEPQMPSLEFLSLSSKQPQHRHLNVGHYDHDVISSKPGKIKLSTNGDTVLLGDEHEVFLDASKAGEGNLSVEVSNGQQYLPIKTIENSKGYTIRILANNIGVFNVYISWNGKFISDNPLKLTVRKRGKVYVNGDGIHRALVGHPASFIVDAREYGGGSLKAKVKGPTSRTKTSIAKNPDDTFTVMYVPTEAGKHGISVFLSEQEIPGSPFVADVKEKKIKPIHVVTSTTNGRTVNQGFEPSFNHVTNGFIGGNQTTAIPDVNKILVFGDGLKSVTEGRVASFIIDPRNAVNGGDLTIKIAGRNSYPICTVQPNPDGTYTATYVPEDVGTFTIGIFWSGNHVTGSPYHAEASNPSRIILCGTHQNTDYLHFEVGRPNVLEFNTSSAGKGILTAFVDGPVGNNMDVAIERINGSSKLSYNPPVEGSYKFHFLWSGNPLPNSPYSIIAENRQIDFRNIHVTGLVAEMFVNNTYEFVIDGSAVQYGVPSAYMQGFTENVPIQIVPQHGNVYRARLTVKESGAYVLHIKWSGHELPGSPYKVNVTQKATPVVQHQQMENVQKPVGTKLTNMLRIGKAYSLTLDANNIGGATIDEMIATCNGPTTSVPVQIRNNLNNTFDLMLTPSEGGSHSLNILVNGRHIEGSPFMLEVSNVSQVRCYGQGLASGPLSTYESSFQCDTRAAGPGKLKIQARGPKGAFNVEILPSSKNRRILNVKFHPSTSGVYTVNVFWDDQHVPGSPFKIKLT